MDFFFEGPCGDLIIFAHLSGQCLLHPSAHLFIGSNMKLRSLSRCLFLAFKISWQAFNFSMHLSELEDYLFTSLNSSCNFIISLSMATESDSTSSSPSELELESVVESDKLRASGITVRGIEMFDEDAFGGGGRNILRWCRYNFHM